MKIIGYNADNSSSYQHSTNKTYRVIHIFVIANHIMYMLKCEYIKTRHGFVLNRSKCLLRLSKNASEFQGISANEFQN